MNTLLNPLQKLRSHRKTKPSQQLVTHQQTTHSKSFVSPADLPVLFILSDGTPSVA